jgi:hypothetical protein
MGKGRKGKTEKVQVARLRRLIIRPSKSNKE